MPRTTDPDLAPEIAGLDFLTSGDQLYLDQIARELLRDNVVLFAGAGVSRNALRRDGEVSPMINWSELADRLAKALGRDRGSKHEVLEIADYYEAKYGRANLIDSVAAAIRDDEHLPGRVHRWLAQLNFPEIVTTNFDTLLERTFQALSIEPQVVVNDADLARRRRHPRIIKMNGCLSANSTDVVVTGNDFLRFSTKRPLIEVFVTKCFVESTVLFIGFSLDDSAFRSINERVITALGTACRQSYSLQFGVSDEERVHWKERKVQLVDLSKDDASPEPRECELRMHSLLKALAQVRYRASAPRYGRGGHRASDTSRKPKTRTSEVAESEPYHGRVEALWESLVALNQSNARLREKARTRYSTSIRKCWNLKNLAVRDRTTRLHFLVFGSLLGPLSEIHTLARSWLRPDGERGLCEPDHFFEPTPADYRLPLLGFFGLLWANPAFFAQAADALWARQLNAEEHILADPDNLREIANRFRFLMRSAYEAGGRAPKGSTAEGSISKWPTVHLQLQRLEKVLSRIFLESEPPNMRTVGAIESLMAELVMGWIFGSWEIPESLQRAWAAARLDVAERHRDEVPWEILVILTLAIDGDMSGFRQLYLSEAWREELFGLAFLADCLAFRFQGEPYVSVETEYCGEGRSELPPCERYVAHVTNFIHWMAHQLATEQPESPERIRCVEVLEEPLARWAGARRNPQIRKSFLRALSAVQALDPSNLGPRLGAWVSEHLSHGAEGLAELVVLVPENGEWSIEEKKLTDLLADLADNPHAVSYTCRRWLLYWTARGVVRQARTHQLLGKIFTQWLITGAGRGDSLGWLSLAAGIQRQDELRKPVERELAVKAPGKPSSLYAFVRSAVERVLGRLQAGFEKIEEQKRAGGDEEGDRLEDYHTKVAAYHPYFVPFAEQFDEAFLDRILGPVVPERSFVREGTAKLLAALLLDGSKTLQEKRAVNWLADLEKLISHGATGEGHLGPLVERLPPEAVDVLQDNLAAAAVRRGERDNTVPVDWIVVTLEKAPAGALPALEEGLVELVASPSLAVAEASLDAILGPVAKKLPAFLENHQRRLRRVKAVVEGRGGYRRTSRFVSLLQKLSS